MKVLHPVLPKSSPSSSASPSSSSVGDLSQIPITKNLEAISGEDDCERQISVRIFSDHVFFKLFSRGHATLHLAVSVGRSVSRYVTFLNSERFSHYCSCPTVRDWIAVYPALFIHIGRFLHHCPSPLQKKGSRVVYPLSSPVLIQLDTYIIAGFILFVIPPGFYSFGVSFLWRGGGTKYFSLTCIF